MDATEGSPISNRGRRSWSWIALLLSAAVFLVYLSVVGRPGRRPGSEGPAIGLHLPYLRLEPLTGDSNAVTLDDLLGRVTLINYWGTWCPPCRREFPQIVGLADTFGKRDDFRLYAVSCGETETDENPNDLRAETEQFLAAKKFVLPTYSDQNAASRRALTATLSPEQHGFGYPTTLVLDRQAVIRGLWQGYDPTAADEMAALIEKLLGEPVGQP